MFHAPAFIDGQSSRVEFSRKQFFFRESSDLVIVLDNRQKVKTCENNKVYSQTKLTENQEPCILFNRTAVDSFAKSSKAEDEYPRQYPKLSGPRAAKKVARIALPTLSLPVFRSDWTEHESDCSPFPKPPIVDSVSAILDASKLRGYGEAATLPCCKHLSCDTRNKYLVVRLTWVGEDWKDQACKSRDALKSRNGFPCHPSSGLINMGYWYR